MNQRQSDEVRASEGRAIDVPKAKRALDSGALLLLEAARSVMHDTRNRLTGISLCLSAWAKTIEPCSGVSNGDFAMFERGLRALEALCDEFAGLETAVAFETATLAAGEVVYWYRDYLSRLGFQASVVDCNPSFTIMRNSRGHAARTLVQLSWLFHKFRATNMVLSAGRSEGASTITVSFETPVSFETVATCVSVRSARALVETAGGRLDISKRERVVEMRLIFCDRGQPRP